MANELPSHVRLRPEVSRQTGEVAIAPVGILADVDGGSGWHISGLQVKEVPPEDDEAFGFVAGHIRNGMLEPATQDEYDHQQRLEEDLARLHPVAMPAGETPPPWNEPVLVHAAAKARKAMMEVRRTGQVPHSDTDDEVPDYETMKTDELRARLSAKGLPTSGTRAKLVERLQEADDSDGEEVEEEEED